jgi:hypothetical protein
MNTSRTISFCIGLALMGQVGSALAQGIYTCVDARGRRITADRPIAECLDREQTELTKTGVVKRVLLPSMTADEREIYEEKIRQELLEQNRRSEERRRNRALLTRYPNKTAHDKERTEALLSLDAATESARVRLVTLQVDKKKLDDEMEFYSKTPSKAPYRLRQQVSDNLVSVEAQLSILKELWLARAVQQHNATSVKK